DVERALARDDEEHLLAVAEPARVRPAGREADHALDEPLAAGRLVDRRAHGGGVAVVAALADGSLGNDVAVHRVHFPAKTVLPSTGQGAACGADLRMRGLRPCVRLQ